MDCDEVITRSEPVDLVLIIGMVEHGEFEISYISFSTADTNFSRLNMIVIENCFSDTFKCYRVGICYD